MCSLARMGASAGCNLRSRAGTKVGLVLLLFLCCATTCNGAPKKRKNDPARKASWAEQQIAGQPGGSGGSGQAAAAAGAAGCQSDLGLPLEPAARGAAAAMEAPELELDVHWRSVLAGAALPLAAWAAVKLVQGLLAHARAPVRADATPYPSGLKVRSPHRRRRQRGGRRRRPAQRRPPATRCERSTALACLDPVPSPTARQVVITGSTRGLGLALARHFLALGDDVVVNGRSAGGVDAAVAALREVRRSRGCSAVVLRLAVGSALCRRARRRRVLKHLPA